MTRGTARVCVFGLAVVMAVGVSVPAWAHGTTERVSVGRRGTQGNDLSFSGGLSVDGRFAAFESFATNLVPGDTNDTGDIFVRDRQMGTIQRVSLGSNGVQADGQSLIGSLSADGRFVAFTSLATNLVPSDTNGTFDVFVHDRQTGTTRRVSVGQGGVQGNDDSFWLSISANGRFVAYSSDATNLVSGDTNGAPDVFVHDRKTGKTERVSLGPGGIQGNRGSDGPAISANGRFVAFNSEASNLVPGDTNGQTDLFVRDRWTGTTRRVSLGPGGAQGNESSGDPAISSDGRFVAFTSWASNLVPGDTNGQSDVFVRDRQTGKTERVSVGQGGVQGNDYSFSSKVTRSISADGRFVAFESHATNLVAGDTNNTGDVFVRDRKMDRTRRMSVGQSGIQADFGGHDESISADGRFVAFWSEDTSLVPHDTNGQADAFVRILVP